MSYWPSLDDVTRGVYAALRLARLDATAIGLIDASPSGTAKSFIMAAFALPLYVLIVAEQLTAMESLPPLFQIATVQALVYVVLWSAFPVLIATILPQIGRADRVLIVIAAYNWSAIVQIAVYMPLIGLHLAGAIPDEVHSGLSAASTIAILAYQVFVIRTALQAGYGLGVAFVLADLIIAQTVIEAAYAGLGLVPAAGV